MKKETTVNQRIDEVMRDRGVTNQELAVKISRHVSTVDRIIENKTTPSYATVKAIAEALNCSVDYLDKGAGGIEPVKASVDPWKDEAYKALKDQNERLWGMVDRFMKGDINFPLLVKETA